MANRRDRFYDWLGFRAARAPRPEAVKRGTFFHSSIVRLPLGLADRLRVLWSGNVVVEFVQVADRKFFVLESAADLAVLPPHLKGPS